jgi:hypothetical protein
MDGKGDEPDGPEVVNVRQYYSDRCDPGTDALAGPCGWKASGLNGGRPGDSVVRD